MRKKQILFATTLIMTGLFACKQKSFTRLASGLEYRIESHEKDGKKPVEGDIVTMHIKTVTGDTTIYDSRLANNNKAVPAQITKPQYNGDIMEGITFLTIGDSAQFRVIADSIFKGNPLPPFIKSGDTVRFYVKIESISTQQEYQKIQEQEASTQISAEDATIQQYLKDNNLNATKTASGLYYVITSPGSGANAQKGQEITMNYTGRLLDGTAFDSNEDPKFGHVAPFKFPLGMSRVIKGWDEGVALLNKGAKAKLIIPSPLAYGASGQNGIPANSILVFDVQMLDAKAMPAQEMPAQHMPDVK